MALVSGIQFRIIAWKACKRYLILQMVLFYENGKMKDEIEHKQQKTGNGASTEV